MINKHDVRGSLVKFCIGCNQVINLKKTLEKPNKLIILIDTFVVCFFRRLS